eukprot:m.166208 g.166208  ORF g.166208 m.166208 type:complete len:89 (-) comp17750_c0_seq5:816-1082(-)
MLLINDTTYLMDEAWELFSTVHNGQATVASPEFAQRPQQEQQSARSQLSQQTGTAKFYVSTGLTWRVEPHLDSNLLTKVFLFCNRVPG